MNRFDWKNEMPDVPESIHTTVIEALEKVNNFPDDNKINVTEKRRKRFYGVKRTAAVAGIMLFFLTLSAFAYSRLSGIAGDEVGFNPVYKGNGIFEITTTNFSDRDLITYTPMTDEKPEETFYPSDLRFEDWTWPTISEKVSAPYGEQSNGTVSDHIHIAGSVGDEVYSVADGMVVQTGFDRTYGNYILIELDENITVKYGHLKEILTEEGEAVSQGQIIAELGKSGMATGANLSFTVYENGEAINPIVE